MIEPAWLPIARSYLGLREVPGPDTDATIARWLRQLGAWWSDDHTPWCGALPAIVFKELGIPHPRGWFRARAWLDWGMPIDRPVLGCVTVLGRGGGGHVMFSVGRDARGRLLGLGGNQSDSVSIAPFDTARVLGHRWPPGQWPAHELASDLPLLASTAPTSRNEA